MSTKHLIFTFFCLIGLPCVLISCDSDSDELESCKTPGFVNCSGICIDPMTFDEYCGANTFCEGYTSCGDKQKVCYIGKCVDPNTNPDPGSNPDQPDPSTCLTFADQTIQSYALVWWDTDHNNCITPQEADAVTEIPYQAFKKNPNVKTLEDLNQFHNLTIIREEAFMGCENLTSIALDHILTLEKNSFYECTGLTSISLPNTKTIGDSTFEGCLELKSLNLSKAEIIGNKAFYKCTGLILIDLPNVKTIGYDHCCPTTFQNSAS